MFEQAPVTRKVVPQERFPATFLRLEHVVTLTLGVRILIKYRPGQSIDEIKKVKLSLFNYTCSVTAVTFVPDLRLRLSLRHFPNP